MKHIVVLGAGIGSVSRAHELIAAPGARLKVAVLNEQPRFSFTPSDPWVAVGWRKPGNIQVDVAPPPPRRDITLVGETVAKIRPAEKCVMTEGGTTINYDCLVLTTGPRLAFDEVPGLGQVRQAGPPGRGRARKLFPAQDAHRQ